METKSAVGRRLEKRHEKERMQQKTEEKNGTRSHHHNHGGRRSSWTTGPVQASAGPRRRRLCLVACGRQSPVTTESSSCSPGRSSYVHWSGGRGRACAAYLCRSCNAGASWASITPRNPWLRDNTSCQRGPGCNHFPIYGRAMNRCMSRVQGW